MSYERALRRLALLGWLPVVASRGAAQTPLASPAPSTLSGVVRDVTGVPLANVEVSLIGESPVVRTDTTGRFMLRSIPPGGHTALFRRIGYRSVDYRWVAQANRELQVAVTMTPVPRQLDRVVIEAPGPWRRRGTSSISGTVVDSSGRAVAGADVRLLGAGLSTGADSSGRFEFRLLTAGSYIVRVRRPGLAPGNYVIEIVDDDHRGITMKLYGLSKRTGARDVASASGYGASDRGFEEFDRRRRANPGSLVLGPGALFRANRRPLDIVLQQYRRPTTLPHRSSIIGEPSDAPGDVPNDGDCLLIDGRRAVYQPLRTFTSVGVQLVEVFRSTAFVDDFVASEMNGVRECRGTMDRHPAYFVLWTRALR